jgi:uncharacterized protein YjbJ (UPF0337 family)
MSNQSLKDKVQGKAHEVKGALTGNKGEEAKGKAQGAKGVLEGKARPARKSSAAKRP